MKGDRTVTKRQQEVLIALGNGRSYKQIAHELYMCAQTAKRHAQAAREILGADSTPHAIILALQKGIIKLEEFASPALSGGFPLTEFERTRPRPFAPRSASASSLQSL